MGVLLVAVQVLFAEVQLMYHAIFGNFMPISQVSMGGNVITNFDSQILYSIGKNIVPILLLLVPLIVTILCLALRKLRVLTVRLKWRQALATLGILLTLLLATMGIMYAGRNKSFSVYKTFTNVNTSTDSSYKSVGMLATTVARSFAIWSLAAAAASSSRRPRWVQTPDGSTAAIPTM